MASTASSSSPSSVECPSTLDGIKSAVSENKLHWFVKWFLAWLGRAFCPCSRLAYL